MVFKISDKLYAVMEKILKLSLVGISLDSTWFTIMFFRNSLCREDSLSYMFPVKNTKQRGLLLSLIGDVSIIRRTIP